MKEPRHGVSKELRRCIIRLGDMHTSDGLLRGQVGIKVSRNFPEGAVEAGNGKVPREREGSSCWLEGETE